MEEKPINVAGIEVPFSLGIKLVFLAVFFCWDLG